MVARRCGTRHAPTRRPLKALGAGSGHGTSAHGIYRERGGADGQTVTVEDEAGQPVDVYTRKIAQAENRAAALEAKAERTHEQAEALHADWKKRADLIPMGQPMLTDHYSYRGDVNNRNRLQAQAERVHDTHRLALERDRKAAAAARTAERLGDPIAQTRRLATVRKELAALGK